MPEKKGVQKRIDVDMGGEMTIGGIVFRGVGMVRAKANIAPTNLVYNICRLVLNKKIAYFNCDTIDMISNNYPHPPP